MPDRYSLLPAGEAADRPLGGGFRLTKPHLRFTKAKQLKDKIAGRYDEATGYAMPGRDGILAGPDQSAIYDDTAVLATPEFASRIQQGVLPMFEHWASFTSGVLVTEPGEKQDLRASLVQVSTYLFELIHASNFGTEVNEGLMDLALGTGGLRIDEAAGDNPFVTRAVPLRGLYFCIGPDGLPDPIWEERLVELQHVRVHYPKANLPAGWAALDACAEIKLHEVWERDWSQPTRVVYRQSVYAPDYECAVLYEEWHDGVGCCPYIVFRWSKASGEGWGRGPLFNILPTMRKVNFAERSLLDHTDIAIAGIWTLEDDGVINPDTVRLEPGTLVPTAPGSAGLRNVAPGANFNIAAFVLEEARSTIKKALFTEQLGNPNKTPMSATEVQQRMAELARAIGSPFGRVLIELVFPAMLRFVRIAKDRKLIKLPAIDGKTIKLVSSSPLAQAQQIQDIENIAGFLQLVTNALGAEVVNVMVDQPKLGAVLAEKYQLPDILRPAGEQATIMQQIAGMAAQRGTGGASTEAGSGADPTAPGAGA